MTTGPDAGTTALVVVALLLVMLFAELPFALHALLVLVQAGLVVRLVVLRRRAGQRA